MKADNSSNFFTGYAKDPHIVYTDNPYGYSGQQTAQLAFVPISPEKEFNQKQGHQLRISNKMM